MTNTIIRNYDSMDYTEKATFLYDFALTHDSDILEGVLLDLSNTTDAPIFDLGDWLNMFDNNAELIQIAQQSDHFDVNDTYICEGIYYNDFTTGDSAIDLIDKDTAIDWIANALEDMPQDVYELTNLIMD
jgi:hypothetical protein